MKATTRLATLAVTLTLGGCSLMESRSYLAEMEEDDDALFQPGQDFPMVPGDKGRYWRSRSEMRRRTPASISERRALQEETVLEDQLTDLETKQSEGARRHYEQYKARLGTVSERIYFLQLRGKGARVEYLSSRGLQQEAAPLNPERLAEASELLLNMTKDDVITSWGRPDRVDIAGKSSYENERWMYHRNGAVKYVYFEAGKVGGWTSTDRGQNTLP